jgi:hypothetical protein
MATYRQTFGIAGHSDVVKASLDVRTIYDIDYNNRLLHYKGKDYILHCDNHVRQTLNNEGSAYCLVSYQERTTGFYAFARLYRSSPSKS